MPKTNAEMCREYRRKKNENINKMKKKTGKSSTERSREFRARKKQLLNNQRSVYVTVLINDRPVQIQCPDEESLKQFSGELVKEVPEVSERGVCRSCLACARVVRLEGEVADLFQAITGQKLRSGDGRPMQVCLVCLAELRRLRAFRRTAASAERALADILRRGLPVTEKEVSKKKIDRTPKLAVSEPTYYSIHTDEDPLECSEAHKHTDHVEIKLEDTGYVDIKPEEIGTENDTHIQKDNINLKQDNSEAESKMEIEIPADEIKIEIEEEAFLAYTSQEYESEDVGPGIFKQEVETIKENFYNYPAITNSESHKPPAKRARSNTVECVCDVCSTGFKSNVQLRRHKESVHGSSSVGYLVIDPNVKKLPHILQRFKKS